MRLHIIARGKIGRGAEADLVDRYLKRIAWPVRLTELPDRGGRVPEADGAVTILLDEKGEQLSSMEPFYPLHAYVCDRCFLVQLEEFVGPAEIFSEYAYFSSYSDTLLKSTAAYAEQMYRRLGLTPADRVIEIASNDGYLLQHFVARGVPCLGVEPAANVAAVAVQKGVPTEVRFLGVETARALAAEGKQADLLLGKEIGDQ